MGLMDQKIDNYRTLVEEELSNFNYGVSPGELYEPIRYILSLGGKRLRPLLAMLAYELYGQAIDKMIRPAASIEVFHNFTLLHDDLMDNAPLRRGKTTVHEKWNPNVAILSGDVMLVKVYDMLLSVDEKYLRSLLQKFNYCAAEVCEGQQYDMNFEAHGNVSETEYLNMIRLKTAVLLGFSLEMGGMLAGASPKNCKVLKNLGEQTGIGFQLKDDLLDVYADQHKFGKQVGGDIISNKKTYLMIKALELAEGPVEKELHEWINMERFNPEEKVNAVTNIYDELNIKQFAEVKMNEYFNQAFESMDQLEGDPSAIECLKKFITQLINREN